MILRVGAPCDRMQIRAEHGQMLCQLATTLERTRTSDSGHLIEATDYTHTSVLPFGRATILAKAMKSDAHALLSVDSDTWCDVPKLIRALDIAQAAFISDRKIGAIGILCPQDDDRVNAWIRQGERLPSGKPWKLQPCWAIGAAVMIHNLDWHRRIQAELPSWPWIGYAVLPTGQPGAYMGEDAVYCVSTAERGGKVLALGTDGGVYHASFGHG